MTEKSDGASASYEEPGITSEDIERIEEFLGKPGYERSIDDLRPSSRK